MKKIQLLIVATNKYIRFLDNLLDSADQFFMKNHEVTYNVFTDKVDECNEMLSNKSYFDKIKIFKIEHKPFPYPTLYRFHFFKRHQKLMGIADYYFYVDADCIIKNEIKDDILGNIVAVQHCGYVEERGTYETNINSTSYIPPNEGSMYYGGGFWGFSFKEFWPFIDTAISMIDQDANNEIIPVWHDESVLNKYLSINQPDKILSPSYHYPENVEHIKNKWKILGKTYECILLLLDKSHQELRK